MSAGAILSAAATPVAVSSTTRIAAVTPRPIIACIVSPRFVYDRACMIGRSVRAVRRKIYRKTLSGLAVVNAVRPHVGGGRHPVRHVEEAGHRGDVPDVAVAEAYAAQRIAI